MKVYRFKSLFYASTIPHLILATKPVRQIRIKETRCLLIHQTDELLMIRGKVVDSRCKFLTRHMSGERKTFETYMALERLL